VRLTNDRERERALTRTPIYARGSGLRIADAAIEYTFGHGHGSGHGHGQGYVYVLVHVHDARLVQLFIIRALTYQVFFASNAPSPEFVIGTPKSGLLAHGTFLSCDQ
jgi:hypothetical protein